jgi:hypothetical protein
VFLELLDQPKVRRFLKSILNNFFPIQFRETATKKYIALRVKCEWKQINSKGGKATKFHESLSQVDPETRYLIDLLKGKS